MKTRVAKAIARAIPRTIIWSMVLAVVAGMITWTSMAALNDWDWSGAIGALYLASSVILVGGLVVWPLYDRVVIEETNHIANAALKIMLWTFVLTIWGGTAGFLFGALTGQLWIGIGGFIVGGWFSLISSPITFTLYEASKRVRFVSKKQDKSHRLVHP